MKVRSGGGRPGGEEWTRQCGPRICQYPLQPEQLIKPQPGRHNQDIQSLELRPAHRLAQGPRLSRREHLHRTPDALRSTDNADWIPIQEALLDRLSGLAV